MFDIGMSELLVIGVVALIVVGPKDLPGMFRTLGRFTAKVKAMGREFSRAMEAAADETGLNEAKDALNAAANPKKFGLDKLNEAATQFEKWDPLKSADGKPVPRSREEAEKAAGLEPDPNSPTPEEVAEAVTPEPEAPAPRKETDEA